MPPHFLFTPTLLIHPHTSYAPPHFLCTPHLFHIHTHLCILTLRPLSQPTHHQQTPNPNPHPISTHTYTITCTQFHTTQLHIPHSPPLWWWSFIDSLPDSWRAHNHIVSVVTIAFCTCLDEWPWYLGFVLRGHKSWLDRHTVPIRFLHFRFFQSSHAHHRNICKCPICIGVVCVVSFFFRYVCDVNFLPVCVWCQFPSGECVVSISFRWVCGVIFLPESVWCHFPSSVCVVSFSFWCVCVV